MRKFQITLKRLAHKHWAGIGSSQTPHSIAGFSLYSDIVALRYIIILAFLRGQQDCIQHVKLADRDFDCRAFIQRNYVWNGTTSTSSYFSWRIIYAYFCSRLSIKGYTIIINR